MTTAILLPRTPETAPVLDWLEAHRDGREARFLRRLLCCIPAQMDEAWTFYYGWSEVYRFFPSDVFVMDSEPMESMDVPRFLAEFMQAGVHRDVTGAIDYPSRRLALSDLATAFLRWLTRELARRERPEAPTSLHGQVVGAVRAVCDNVLKDNRSQGRP